MSITQALLKASAKPAGKRPYFLDPEVERVMAITMAVVQELAVVRQRADTLERILRAKGMLNASEIDAFEPTKDEAAERGLWTQEYLARVLRIVQQEGEAGAKGDMASEEVAVELNRTQPNSSPSDIQGE
jgi:hypothetical protein